MFKPTIRERLIHKIAVKTQRLLAPIRRKQLASTDFSIISNNCWGGVAYEYYGLQKQSPTVGTYFYAEEYIKFLENFKECVESEIVMISASASRYAEDLKLKGEDVPVGRLINGAEVVFLHYKNPELAKEKWNRRTKRLNWENLVFKFSYMNDCTEEIIERFDSLDLPGKKIAFVRTEKEAEALNCGVYYPGYEKDEQIENDTFYWNKYFDVTAFLNGKGIVKK